MKASTRPYKILAGSLLLEFASRALAHGHDNDGRIRMANTSVQLGVLCPTVESSNSTNVGIQSYFRYSEHSSLILAHIVVMSVGWIFVLPLGVVLSIAQSRLSLLVQFIFLLTNGIGVLLATIYNHNTPDLYTNNAHHKIGWILTWTVFAQVLMALICSHGGKNKMADSGELDERVSFIPISAEAMEEHQRIHNLASQNYRFSNDSGQGTERNTESLRSHSISSIEDLRVGRASSIDQKYETVTVGSEKRTHRLSSSLNRLLYLRTYLSHRTLRAVALTEAVINHIILILGFIALTTGIVTYVGIFQGSEIFSGLAHFIKGGVFFWYGILTLGRWAGCFADFGWAWNIKPSKSIVGSRKAAMPSAEFIESFLIFFYGSTNVFLEHLGAWGQVWSAQDLEHISITVMFIGGGLCGMLIESRQIRELLNTTIQRASFTQNHNYHVKDNDEPWQLPRSYSISMNPIPALIILLLGLVMSSHHQASMVSTMVHKQWGTLLAGAALARATTYILFYLSPPTSLFPSRPPSELITAFCLMAGGIIFMASSHDTIEAMEYNDLNAMFVFTVTMGFISFLMAWIILVIAVKGWAMRRGQRGASTAFT